MRGSTCMRSRSCVHPSPTTAHLAGRLAAAHALSQHLGCLLQLTADEHLANHQESSHHQEAHQGQQVGQLHRRLQALSNIAQQRRRGAWMCGQQLLKAGAAGDKF